ncbi:EamA family transporter [Candidatus Saccharibacteria bacterium]|nr:EamA family transporter [Candidatus Saccharibacteria bacterium]
MNWLVFIGITLVVDSLRIFIDNYVSDVYFKGHQAVAQKLFYGYSISIISILILAVTGFNFTAFTPTLLIALIVAGVINSISSIFYYRALELDDSTNLGIFIQLAPVLYLVLGWLFLGETISPIQFAAFAIIVSAPLLIILTTRKKTRKLQIKAALFSFLYVLIAVISNLIFVKANTTDADFITITAVLLLAKSLTSLAIVYSVPKWHHRFHYVWKRNHSKLLRPMLANTIIGSTKEYAYRAALVTAPTVALASAVSDSSGPIVIFFMGIILTLIWPRFGREKLEKKTIVVHIIAVLLVVAGVVILQL